MTSHSEVTSALGGRPVILDVEDCKNRNVCLTRRSGRDVRVRVRLPSAAKQIDAVTLFAGESLNSSSLSAVPENAAAPNATKYRTHDDVLSVVEFGVRGPSGIAHVLSGGLRQEGIHEQCPDGRPRCDQADQHA
jgi:hypothetical protein